MMYRNLCDIFQHRFGKHNKNINLNRLKLKIQVCLYLERKIMLPKDDRNSKFNQNTTRAVK